MSSLGFGMLTFGCGMVSLYGGMPFDRLRMTSLGHGMVSLSDGVAALCDGMSSLACGMGSLCDGMVVMAVFHFRGFLPLSQGQRPGSE